VSAADDRALAAAARAGDRDALDTLLRRHLDRLHALCRRIVGNDADAHDATQEALIAICRGIGRFDGRSAFSTWAYRVATNACLDELRRRARRPVVALDEARLERTPAASTGGAAADDRVAARLDVDRALTTLAPDFRAAVVLRDLCELDYAEIAEVLGIPAGTVRSRIARGRAALAVALGNQTDDPRRPTPRP
jgi:RNA polymerase sigma-70 factor (ECF subfamily)